MKRSAPGFLLVGGLVFAGVQGNLLQAQPESAADLPPVAQAVMDEQREQEADLQIPREPLAHKLFYLPTHDEPANPATWGSRFREVDFDSADGTRLHGWWIESPRNPPLGAVVFSHGNVGSMGHHLGFVMWLVQSGYEVFIYDYRGYGKSQGSTDRKGMVEDARAALDHVSKRMSSRKLPVISYGHSLGGAKSVSAIASGRNPGLKAVITDAAFASYREMARNYGGRLAAGLVTDELSPVDQIAGISPLPVLIIHGKLDPVVPFSQGLKLFRAAKSPKAMFEVGQGLHGDNLSRDEGAYRKRVLEWIDALDEKDGQ
ncbi:MAG: alpha/beta fold hydrolase [Akkermansiaceae bacterium]|nr:alpha/beta fold hydrolase [Akkermansiaceae bacterium]